MSIPRKFIRLTLVSIVMISFGQAAVALDALRSVVSVLPVWSGQAQGSRNVPSGRAPEGSGVVIAPGVIATAFHVVEPALSIDVRLPDGRIIDATLIAADEATDVALLSFEADLPAVTPASRANIAEPVCAAGNAYGLGISVTCGVVSAIGVSDAGFNPVEDFIQTDAAINPGMSGGALFNDGGDLVGMVSAIFSSDADSNIGMNFAVSADLLLRVADALLEEGSVRLPAPAWSLGQPDRSVLSRIVAPVVLDVKKAGPADQAGIMVGDLLLTVAGRRVLTERDVVAALALVDQMASDYAVQVERDGRVIELIVLFNRVDQTKRVEENARQPDCPHPDAVCRVRQAVFPVSSFDPLGSATRIGETLLVTNRHVVGDRSGATVLTPNGPLNAEVVASAYTGDLVLLEVDGLPDQGYIAGINQDVANAGEYFAIGADITREEVRVFDPGGLIAGPAEGAVLGRLHVYARMQPGVSGGALVDQNGFLVGIAVGGGDRRFEAIPVQDVRRLLDLRSVPSADRVTQELGTAFAQCENHLEAARSGSVADGVFASLQADCAASNNQGQLLEAGRVLAAKGDFKAAAVLHSAAVAQVPNSINAQISLLVSLQLGARFKDMIPHARRLMEMAPNDPQALRFAIQSGVWGGDPDLAENGYQALLEADPVQAQAARRFIDSAPPAPPPR